MFVFALILSAFLFKNIIQFTSLISRQQHFLIATHGQTLNQKRSSTWEPNYSIFEALQTHTPTTSLIIHPPQIYPYEVLGNQLLLRGFLYPRQFYSNSQTPVPFPLTSSSYIVIPENISHYPWPTIPLSYQDIYFINLQTNKLQIFDITENTPPQYAMEISSHSYRSNLIPLYKNIPHQETISLHIATSIPNSASLVLVGRSNTQTIVISGPANSSSDSLLTLNLKSAKQLAHNLGFIPDNIQIQIKNSLPPLLPATASAIVHLNDQYPESLQIDSQLLASQANYLIYQREYDQAQSKIALSLKLQPDHLESLFSQCYLIKQMSQPPEDCFNKLKTKYPPISDIIDFLESHD